MAGREFDDAKTGSQGSERYISEAERADWFARPEAFVEHELGGSLWSMQADILRAVRDHERVAVRSCNGSGKTYTAAYAVLWWLMCFRNSLVITTAPTEHQVRDIMWREIRRAYRGHEDLIDGTLLRTSLELGDKHYANGLSTNAPDRFQGFHQDNILFVVDEAPGVAEEIFEAIEGSMTSARARLLLLGNPTARSGTFYEAFHGRRELWETIHISAFDTPNFQTEGADFQAIDREAGELAVPGLVTPKWAADALVNWGETSPMYQVRVLGEFPSEGEDTLIPLRLIEAAVNREIVDLPPGESEDTSEEESAVKTRVEIGVDVARFGSDRTVICIRKGPRVLSLSSYQRQDTMATAGAVAKAIADHEPGVVRVDEIGIGAGVVDRLRELGLKHVKGANVSARASNSEQFLNARAEIFDGLRERFESGRISIPEDRELIGQLAALRYSFTSSGQMKLEGKDELRRRGLPSPDRADALALAFASIMTNEYVIFI
ncbi:MAG: hypothetical protein IH868_06130 [Chloroflexi bacterium]|nr:hypothetical protein [Chloroflexota bacterium]